jgi:hypothetical protein
MTVGELRRQLDEFNDAQPVIFTPSEYCGEGYPEWEGAQAGTERDVFGCPTGAVVVITLTGERE